MRSRFALFFALGSGVSLSAAALIACSSPEPKSKIPFDYRDDDTDTKKDAGKTRREDPPQTEEDPPLADGGKPPGRVYAHTAKTLYLFDPLAETLTKIGDLSCLNPGDRLLDIALDRDSVMYGTSDDGFLRIDPVDARCSYVKEDPAAQYPNSLSFVPMGTVDDTKEVLVGYQFDPDAVNEATFYVQIDLGTGTMTKVGDLNPPGAAVRYKSSGDLISTSRNGNKAYLSVKKVSDPEANDYLAEIDPKTGTIKTIVGDVTQKNLYGLAQWAGTAYGFNDDGNIIEIDMATGAGTTLMTLTEDAGVVAWFGAGMTTIAPTKP